VCPSCLRGFDVGEVEYERRSKQVLLLAVFDALVVLACTDKALSFHAGSD
jgi:hypothetical protein